MTTSMYPSVRLIWKWSHPVTYFVRVQGKLGMELTRILPVWVYQRSTYSSVASHLAIASRLVSSSIVQHQHLPKQYHLGPTVDIALWKKIHVDEFNFCEVRARDYSASRCIKQLDHTNVDEQSALPFLGSVLSLMERPNVKALGRLQVGPTRPPCSWRTLCDALWDRFITCSQLSISWTPS